MAFYCHCDSIIIIFPHCAHRFKFNTYLTKELQIGDDSESGNPNEESLKFSFHIYSHLITNIY